jgi:hypothetical protein
MIRAAAIAAAHRLCHRLATVLRLQMVRLHASRQSSKLRWFIIALKLL